MLELENFLQVQNLLHQILNTLLGEVPEVKNFFVCCGFNSIGIASQEEQGKLQLNG